MSPPKLKPAPKESPYETAKWKLEEAHYHLKDIAVKDFGNSREFKFEVSAVITPARSAHELLQKRHNPKGFRAWEQSLDAPSRNALDIGENARNFEVHRAGAAMSPNLPFTWIPTPGNYCHGFHVKIRGADEVVPVVGILKRYLGLLKVASEKLR